MKCHPHQFSTFFLFFKLKISFKAQFFWNCQFWIILIKSKRFSFMGKWKISNTRMDFNWGFWGAKY